MTTTRRLENPTAEDLDQAARLAASAFAEDASTLISLGGDSSLLYAFERAVLAAAAVGGHLYVASYGEMPFAGVAAWFAPGQAAFSTDEQRNAGFNQLVEQIPPALQMWWLEYFMPKWENQVKKSLGEDVRLNSWHLQLLAISPGYQNKGIGRALMDLGEAKASQDAYSVRLETGSEKNVAIYARRGYELKSRETFKGLTGQFCNYVMLKSAGTP